MRAYHGSLRGRLVLQLTVVVFFATTAFAEVAGNVLGFFQSDAVDARVRTAAAALALVAAQHATLPASEVLRTLATPSFDGAVLSRRGTVIASTAPVPDVVKSAAVSAPPIAAARKLGRDETQYRAGFMSIAGRASDRVAVFWHRVDHGSNDADERATAMLRLTIPLIVVGAFLIGDRLMRGALLPLTDLAQMAKTIEATDLSRRIDPMPADGELAELCGTLNRMFARLESAFERQRRFTADVSHEFRAPLSVITAEADLSASGLASIAEYRQSAHVVLREAKLIESMTEDLLTIARGEAGIAEATTAVNAAEAARSAVQTLERAAHRRSIAVQTALDPDAWIAANPRSVTRVCVALLDNALKFTDTGSTVTVEVRRVRDTIQCVFSDEGPGLSADGLTHAFERFWRDDEMRGRSGTGLGLAIVKSLVTQSHGAIRVENLALRGCRVTVTFPAARLNRT